MLVDCALDGEIEVAVGTVQRSGFGPNHSLCWAGRPALVAYVLLCRIGISRRTHLASLGGELGGLLITGWALGAAASVAAVLTVYRLIDLNPRYPPGAQLVIPLSLLTVTVVLLLGAALLGSLSAQRAADAAEPAALLRGGE